MDKSLYVRPNKPKHIAVKKWAETPVLKPLELPKVLEVGAQSECHVTPPSVAESMAYYLGEVMPNDRILEPQAGTGNLVNALLDKGVSIAKIVAIEQNYRIADFLKNRFNSLAVTESCFIEAAQTLPLFNQIICNPPFKAIRTHMKAAEKCLADGGVMVALVPVTFEHDTAEELERLPVDTFSSAKVMTKIIRICK